MPGLILDGIRVVDLSWGLAGPVATQMLAEAGADVVKVEPPGGDPVRRLHPSAFATWNRSKRGVVLDLDDARLAALLSTADVLVHGLSHEVARRHGLDDEILLARHPRLVVCGISGYPASHADAQRPSHDILVQAHEGFMDVQSGWREGPFAWRFPAPSWGAAFLAAAGIVARLFSRERSGVGGAAHTSLAQGVHLFQNNMWSRAERPSPSLLEGLPGTLVHTQVGMYECGDSAWLQILNPAGRVDLSDMPLMSSAREALGLARSPFDADVMRAAMRLHPAAAWLEQIRARDVAAELIAPFGSLLDHEQVRANDFAVDVDDPVFGRLRQAAPPFSTGRGWAVRGPAPRLGEHDAELPAPSAGTEPTRAPRPGGGEPLLSGVRVVDFGAFLAGPLAPMLLADLGADVVKVEPVRGDPVRGWRDGFFVACNRGKRGLALDIGTDAGRDVVDRLISWADVVHHNIRADATARLGLDADHVAAVNPRAVLSHGSAYGLAGERAAWPGYDSVFQAMAGWPLMVAGEGNPPLFLHPGTLDILTGAASAVATLLALYHRARTGEAVGTEAALLNTATYTTSETSLNHEDAILPVPLFDAGQHGPAPGYRIYRAGDGWVAVAALGDDARAALRTVAGVDHDTGLEDSLATRDPVELVVALTAAGVPAEQVRELRYFSVWDDEENRRTRMVVSYDQRDWGRMDQFGAYWDLGNAPLVLERACPAVGEHSVEVLTDLGLTAEQVSTLVAAGVVTCPEEGTAT